jgi:hypothetical protein
VAGRRLERTTLHLLRHACKSFLDAAGVSVSRADRYIGHGRHSIGDRYRDALKGQLASDARLLDDYLAGRSAEVARLPTVAQAGAQPTETAQASRSG